MNDATTSIAGGGHVIPLDDLKSILRREGTLLVLLGFAGLVLLPVCIYVVGLLVFGRYEDGGFGEFFGDLRRELFSGEPAVLFLLLSPWILWQLMRLVIWGFRRLTPPPHTGEPPPPRQM